MRIRRLAGLLVLPMFVCAGCSHQAPAALASGQAISVAKEINATYVAVNGTKQIGLAYLSLLPGAGGDMVVSARMQALVSGGAFAITFVDGRKVSLQGGIQYMNDTTPIKSLAFSDRSGDTTSWQWTTVSPSPVASATNT